MIGPETPWKRGRRQRMAEALESLRLVPLMRGIHNRGRTSVVVLAYHRVVPYESIDAYPLDAELISATPDAFDWQMKFLRQRMNPVSLSQVVAALDGGAALPRHAVAVTFDDGFRDTFVHAFPSLARHRIPATVFLSTAYVDSDVPFWFEQVAHMMMQLPPGSIELPECGGRFPCGTRPQQRRASTRELQSALKGMPNERRTRLIEEWTQRFPQPLPAPLDQSSKALTWAQVRDMARSGIEIGSHTVSHPNLTQLSDTALDFELRESRRIIEERLERDVTTLAYPIGTASAFDERVVRHARQAGYRLAVTYRFGANWIGSLQRYELRRHGVGPWMSSGFFAAMMALPDWVHE